MFRSPAMKTPPSVQPLRLTIVTQFFPPDFAATGQYMDELATHLGDMGMDVHVFTGQPSYAFEVAEAPAEEQRGRVHITRSSFLRDRSRQMTGRTLSSLAFCLHAFWHLLQRRHRGDLILFVSEPPYLQTLGLILNLIFGTAYVCLVYDLYPDVVEGLDVLPPNHPILKIWDRLNRWVWRRAAQVIVPCGTMRDRILQKHPELQNSITVIHNWSDPDWIKPLAKAENSFVQAHQLGDRFTVLYSGNMGRCHDMSTILGAAQELDGEPIEFVFIGGGPKLKQCQQQVAEWGLSNCRFLPYQDKTLLPQSLTACNLHLVSIDVDMEGLVAPSKFYSALSSGRPVAIICEAHSYLRELVSAANCGAAFVNGDRQGLANFIRYLSKDAEMAQRLGLSGHQYIWEHFTVQAISQQYYRLIRQAIIQHADLYHAFENHEFDLYYQPIVNLSRGSIHSLEALLRWHHPDRGVLLPADFLTAAKETDLIVPLGWQMLEQLGAQGCQWQRHHSNDGDDICPLRLSMNLSSRQFFHPELLIHIDAVLTHYEIPGESLILEIKDHTVIQDTAATIGILLQLQARGIQVCIDDFGTHYSALNFLHRFPVNILKIAPSIIHRLDIDASLAEWLSSLILIANDLNITLVAQGIETAFQQQRVRELGIRYGQGFYFAKPQLPASLEADLQQSYPFSFLFEPIADDTPSSSVDAPLVLIVDDDRALRGLLKRAVMQAGYRVMEAANAQQALATYEQITPDLILLDAMMPQIDGFTLCRCLRSLPCAPIEAQNHPPVIQHTNQIPILMITALDDEASIERAFQAGATDYITKPVNWAILKQRLKRLLDS